MPNLIGQMGNYFGTGIYNFKSGNCHFMGPG
jgi:hypothetical protein